MHEKAASCLSVMLSNSHWKGSSEKEINQERIEILKDACCKMVSRKAKTHERS